MKINLLPAVSAAFLLGTLFSSAHADNADDHKAFNSYKIQFFRSYCTSCHGEKKPKGDVSLHDISLDFKSDEVGGRWVAVLNQLENGEMPPKKKPQPAHAERQNFIAAIKNQFSLAGKPVEQMRGDPKYGNYVNHEALFSGEHKGPSFSRPRIWRISPYIDGKSSPFSLSQVEGFKDYAQMWSLDKPTMELLMAKSRGVVETQIGPSEADLKVQDQIWRDTILNRRRALKKEVEQPGALFGKEPNNEGHKKKLENKLKELKKKDLPALQGAVLFVAAVFVLVNLAVDLCYAKLDPRIRLDGGRSD